MAYVYRHIRLDKKIPFYIGIGSDEEGKYYRANTEDSRNKIWRDITSRAAYEVQIVLEGLSWEEACLKEIEFIEMYGRIDKKTGTLANMTKGGEGVVGRVDTEERKQKWKKSREGFQHSEVTKQKLSIKHTGKTHSKETKEKIRTNKKQDWQNPEHPFNSLEYREQKREHMVKNNPMHDPEIRARHKQAVEQREWKGGTVLRDLNIKQVTCPHCKKSGGYTSFKQFHFDRCETFTGIKHTKPEYTCPHCNKTGKGASNMQRWHFENCKYK